MNIPEVKLGIIAVSRDCFPIALSTQRRSNIVAAYGEGLYECPVTVENENDALKALADVQAGRTGPIPRQLQNKHYDGEDAAVKGQHYKYAHSYKGSWVQQQYLPDALVGVQYYHYGENKNEQAAKAYWERIKSDPSSGEKRN